MTRNQIEQSIKEIIVKTTKIKSIEEIDNQVPLAGYFNSITYIQFLICVEDTFDLDFNDEVLDLAGFQNLNDVLLLLYSLLEER